MAKIENLLEPRRIWELGRLGSLGDWEFPEMGRLEDLEIREIGGNLFAWQKKRTSWNLGGFGRLGDSEASGDWEKSVYVAEVGNGVRANEWKADELGNWGLGRFRGLEDSEVWEVREIGEFGRLGNSGDSGDSGIRESGRFGRLGKIIICGKN